MRDLHDYTVTLYVVGIRAESPEGAAAIAATLIPSHVVGYLLPEPHIENEVVVEWHHPKTGVDQKATVAIHHHFPTATITTDAV